MLDKLVLHLHEQISLDGRRGTSLKRLWDFTQTYLNNYADRLTTNVSVDVLPRGFKPTLDGPLKSYIWDALRYNPDIFVQMSDQPDSSRQQTPIKQEVDADMEDAEDVYIDDTEADIKEENNGNSQMPDYTALPEAKNLSLSELMFQYGSNVLITTSPASQLHALTGGIKMKEDDPPISSTGLQILEEAGRRRQHGITQIDLGRILELEAKNVFHFVKMLMKRGLIFKRPVVMKGSTTMQVLLSRYRHLFDKVDDDNEDDSHILTDPFIDMDTEKTVTMDGEATKKRISRCLESAPGKSLLIEDLKPLVGIFRSSTALTRWFNRTILLMEERGYVERIHVPNNTGRKEYDRCLRLLKPYTGNEQGGDQDDIEQRSASESSSEVEIAADIPLEYQLYDMIRASGERGMTSTQVHANLPLVSFKYLFRVLEDACTPGAKPDESRRLYRLGTMEGRKRFYLYYTRDVFTIRPELEQQMEKANKHPLPEDKDSIGPEKDPFIGKKVSAAAGTIAEAKIPKKRGRPRKHPLPTDNQKAASSVPPEDTTPLTSTATPTSEHPTPDEKSADNQVTRTEPVSTEAVPTQETDDSMPKAKKRKTKKEVQADKDSRKSSHTPSSSTVESQVTDTATDDVDNSKNSGASRKRTAEQDAVKETAKRSKEELRKTDSATAKDGQKKSSIQQTGLKSWLQSTPSTSREKNKAAATPTTSQPAATGSSTKQNEDVSQPMQVDATVDDVSNDKSRDLKETRTHVHIAPDPSTPLPDLTPSSGSESPGWFMKKRKASSNLDEAEKMFTADFPQKDAPDTIAGQKVVPFPESWKSIFVKEGNANQPYFRRRAEAILQVIKNKKFAIFDAKFISEVSDILDANMAVARTAILDRKSVIRATVALGQTEDIRVYPLEFQRLNGSTSIFILLLLPNISPTNQEMIDYVTAQKEIISVPAGRGGVSKNIIKKEDFKVERLADRIKRLESSIENGDDSDALRQLQMLKESKKAFDIQSKRRKANRGGHNSMIKIAVRHGFIIAKMIRAKIFMQCLRQMADAHNSNTVVTDDICRDMTLRSFAQVIGIFVDTPAARTALADEQKLNTSLQRLDSKTIKAVWAKKKQNLRTRVKSNLNVIHALGLIKPTVGDTVDDDEQLSPSFTLSDTAELRDYSKPGLPVVDVLPVRTVEDIEEYWRQLQTICLKVIVFPDEDTEEAEKRIEELRNEQSQLSKEKGYITGILTSLSWEGKFLYSDKQIEVLNSYVDIENRRTPYDDPILCEEIAANIGLPLKRVHQYYRQVQYYKLRRRKNMRKHPRPGEEGLVTDEHTTFHMVPFRPAPLHTARRGRKSVIYRRNTRNIKNENLAEDDNIPTVDQTENLNGDDTQRPLVGLAAPRIRQPWTTNEDELLSYAYAIMKARRTIRWEPMRHVIPSRKTSSCRSRMGLLMRSPVQKSRVMKLTHAWQEIYRDAIRTGKLEEAKIVDDKNQVVTENDIRSKGGSEKYESHILDQILVPYLTYFLSVLREDPSLLDNAARFNIPATIDALQTEYDVNMEIPIVNAKSLVDQWDNIRGSSFVTKNRVLCSTSFFIRNHWTHGDLEVDYALTNRDNRLINDIKVMLKMILLTPGDKYDPKIAYQSLYRYPMELVSMAIKESTANNILTRAKYSNNNKTTLPTRSFGMTDKFLAQLAGTLPQRTFARATAYRHHLLNLDEIAFSATCSSGMIYCLLDMFAYKKAIFNLRDEPGFCEQVAKPYYVNRLTETRKYAFNVDVDLRNDTPPSSSKAPIQATYEEIDQDTWHKSFKTFQKKHSHAVVGLIAGLLETKKGDGISLIELKRQLGATGLSDKQLSAWIEKMKSHSPPLVTYVGAANSILVSSSYIRSWAPRLKSSEDNDDGKLVPARMWYDIQGRIMEHVLRGCMQVVLEQIQQNPGISSSTILHKLKTLLVPGEVYDILRMLEHSQCIKSKAIAYPACTTLFSKPRIYQTQDRDSITKEKLYCYWTLPDCWINVV